MVGGGMESSDKNIIVINERVDENSSISMLNLINENGGLLRIPFLTKTNAVIYLIKYWGR